MGTLGGITGTNTGGSATSGAPNELLQGMEQAMRTAADHADHEQPGDAMAVLQTGHGYVAFADQAVAGLGSQLERRSERLERLRASGADATTVGREQVQLDLLGKLRDRIALSAERIRDIMSGSERQGDDDEAEAELLRRKNARKASQAMVEQDLSLLQQQSTNMLLRPNADLVASTYGASSASR